MRINHPKATAALRRRAQTLLVWSATLAALAMLGTVLAYWTWQLLAPRHAAAARIVETPRAAAGDALFGVVSDSPVTAAASSLRLVGVAAGAHARDGHALVHDGVRTRVARAGEEIVPGVRVLEVHPSSVVLDRAGVRQVLDWPAQRTADLHAAPPARR